MEVNDDGDRVRKQLCLWYEIGSQLFPPTQAEEERTGMRLRGQASLAPFEFTLARLSSSVSRTSAEYSSDDALASPANFVSRFELHSTHKLTLQLQRGGNFCQLPDRIQLSVDERDSTT